MEINEEEWKSWHGFGGKNTWPKPNLVARSDKPSREDQLNMIPANEYVDTPEVMEEKVNIVVSLIKQSNFLLAYTGAGLSKASGIPDYATKSEETVVEKVIIKSPLYAEPTYAHQVLTEMERSGYLKHWIQQNHDGLPQKAGYPQEKMNEVHGGWFDPSNPVVKMSGNLRDDLFKWMIKWEEKADLCLCLGSSLSGMNADRTAKTIAKKSVKGKTLGTVIINLQQTPHDSLSVIRIFGKLDDVFKLIEKKLNVKVQDRKVVLPKGDVFTIPYDEKGKKDKNRKLKLELTVGSKVKIADPGAPNFGAEGVVKGTRSGQYLIEFKEGDQMINRLLGVWWVDAALRGTVPQIPIVNV